MEKQKEKVVSWPHLLKSVTYFKWQLLNTQRWPLQIRLSEVLICSSYWNQKLIQITIFVKVRPTSQNTGNEGCGPLLNVYQITTIPKNILKSILASSSKPVLNIISEGW